MMVVHLICGICQIRAHAVAEERMLLRVGRVLALLKRSIDTMIFALTWAIQIFDLYVDLVQPLGMFVVGLVLAWKATFGSRCDLLCDWSTIDNRCTFNLNFRSFFIRITTMRYQPRHVDRMKRSCWVFNSDGRLDFDLFCLFVESSAACRLVYVSIEYCVWHLLMALV